MEPLISILIAAYNLEGYVARCLDSIIVQDYQNREIIVYDDGSTDNTRKICMQYEGRGQIRLICSDKNDGLSYARNSMLREAKGDFVLWVDGDDYLAPGYVSRMYGYVLKYNADIVRPSFPKDRLAVPATTVFTQEQYIRLLLDDTVLSYITGSLHRRSLYNGVEEFPYGFKAQDYAISPSLVKNSSVIVYVKDRIYNYDAIRPDSTTNTSAKRADGLYCRALLSWLRYVKYHFEYPEECERVIAQTVEYSSTLGYIKLLQSGIYSDWMKDILLYLKTYQKQIYKNSYISRYKKLLVWLILHNHNQALRFFGTLHQIKGRW